MYRQISRSWSRLSYTWRHERNSDSGPTGPTAPTPTVSTLNPTLPAHNLRLRRLSPAHIVPASTLPLIWISSIIYLPLSFVIHMGQSYLAALVCLSPRDSTACAASLVRCVQFPVSLPRCLGHVAPFQSGDGGVPVPVPRGRRQRVFRVTRLVS